MFSEKQPAVPFADCFPILYFQQKQKAKIIFYFAAWFKTEFGTFSSFAFKLLYLFKQIRAVNRE